MSYRTILVHADHSKHAAERIRIAANVAKTENAHLIGLAMTGISRFMYEARTLGPAAPNLEGYIEFLRSRAEQALAEFDSIARAMGVLSVEKRLIDDEAGGGISLQARYCDLVVIGQNDPEEPSPNLAPDFPEYTIMNCGRPVLVVPYAGRFEHAGKQVLVAWDAGLEATRAVTSAIPLLKQAENVVVTVFNSSKRPEAHGKQPGADIALYLARHDVKVEVMQRTTDIDIGNSLLSLVTDLSSDLIVMGGYGHSRFREILLGGVTRTILESMTVPVWMSH